MWFMTFDPLYWLLVGPAVLLAFYAQFRVKSAYARYSRVGTQRGVTGAEAARRILASAGIRDVSVEATRGWLSDHYDPRAKTLKLSPEVHDGRSVASVGIAAHEAGHALQDAGQYAPLRFRSAVVPMAGIGSVLVWPMILGGMIFRSLGLIQLGILLFAVVVVFQIITLPVEFNASSRAKAALADAGIVVTEEEASGVSQVLSAAALTYVAATVAAIAQLLYFLLRFGVGGGDD
ncbi:MAG TPA: zinc metallopeptidase [Planctomycetota bacterium]|nr:zinc metallopeptidase [Planctomycetota bacterium]